MSGIADSLNERSFAPDAHKAEVQSNVSRFYCAAKMLSESVAREPDAHRDGSKSLLR